MNETYEDNFELDECASEDEKEVFRDPCWQCHNKEAEYTLYCKDCYWISTF